MDPIQDLHLYQEILLLTLGDHSGTPVSGSMCNEHACAGALLAELLLIDRIRCDTEGKRVELVSGTRTGDELLDELLELIGAREKPASLRDWMGKTVCIPRLHHRAAESLCDQGILRTEKKKVLFLFDRTVYPELNPAPERELLERLRQAIFHDGNNVSERTSVVVSLAYHSRLLHAAFGSKEVERCESRIKALSRGEHMGAALAESVQAVIASTLVTTMIMPVILCS